MQNLMHDGAFKDAIIRPQPAHLPFVVRAKIRILAAFIDETVPDVDVDDSGALCARAIP